MSDDIVVNFTIGGGALTSFGFGTPMLIAEYSPGTGRQNGPFTSADDLVDFGLTTSHPAYDWATTLMSQRPRPGRFMLGRVEAMDANMTATLAAIAAEGIGSWHTSFLESRDLADQVALATFTASHPIKAAVMQTSEDDPANLVTLTGAGFHNSILVYHPEDNEFLDAAWGGRCLGQDLNQVQGKWSHQGGPGNTLSGIAGTQLTNPEKAAFSGANINYYAPKVMTSGVAIDPYTYPGLTLNGRFIEQEFSIQWILARLEESLHQPFFSADGVPFDNSGFALLEAKANGVFGRGLSIGHLVERRDLPTNRLTPYLDVVPLEDVEPGDEADALVRMSGVVHIGKKARRVVLNITANLGA
jgi:hypothetical protein